MTRFLEHRTWISLGLAGVIGVAAQSVVPWRAEDPLLVMVGAYCPGLYRALYAGYVTLLFTTPFLATSVAGALAYIFIRGRAHLADAGPLPAYPEPETRDRLFVILGEQHHALKPVPSAVPTWLALPERGLLTGIVVIGVVGSGKTTGCLWDVARK